MMPGGSPVAAVAMAAPPPVPERGLGGGASGERESLTTSESDRGTIAATTWGGRGSMTTSASDRGAVTATASGTLGTVTATAS